MSVLTAEQKVLQRVNFLAAMAKRRGIPPEDEEEAKTLYLDGKSVEWIAEWFGISQLGVRLALRRANTPMRPRGARPGSRWTLEARNALIGPGRVFRTKKFYHGRYVAVWAAYIFDNGRQRLCHRSIPKHGDERARLLVTAWLEEQRRLREQRQENRLHRS